MKNTIKMVRLLSAAGFLIVSAFASAEVVVIVNSASPVNSASADDIAQIFLGKRNEIAGATVVAVDQTEGNASRAVFYEKVVQKSGSQLNAYWSRLIFTGKGAPPQQVGSDSEVAEAVIEDEEAIGYIDSSAVVDGVKVIYTVK